MFKCEACGSLHTEGNHLCHCGSFLWRVEKLSDGNVVMAADLETVVKSKTIDCNVTPTKAQLDKVQPIVESIAATQIKNSWVTGK